MSFIQREIDRISAALREPRNSDEYRQMYAAQQALLWASEPNGFASPTTMITGISPALEDCPAGSHPA